LTESTYRVGRSPKCEIYLGPENFDKNAYALISKYHFTIIRDQLENNLHIVYLQDLSSNGTYVNGKKVGKERRVLIKTSDEISLAKAGNKGKLDYINVYKRITIFTKRSLIY
jgi:serine/threonine-protein kinase Chk2